MEMPTPCQHCDEIFDLLDGSVSNKWYPNTVICESCGEKEDIEIEKDAEIEDLKSAIEDAEFTIRDSHKRLKELQEYTSSIFISLE